MPLWPHQIANYEQGRDSANWYVHNVEWWLRQTGKAPLLTDGAWSLTNMAIYTPFLVSEPRIAFCYVQNGTTKSGLMQMGIYAPDAEGLPGQCLRRFAADLQAQDWQQPGTPDVGPANLWLGRGFYYFACVLNNTTGQVKRLCALTTDQSGPIMGGIFTEASAFPLPLVATPNKAGVVANVPIIKM